MEIPVFVEPAAGGFRATTGAPLVLTADGPTADAAVVAVQAQLAERLKNGAQLRTVSVNGQPEQPDDGVRIVGGIPLRPLGEEGVRKLLRFVQEHPMTEEDARVIEEYRREHNTIPDPDDPTTW
jgi:hypothetical protein